MSILHRRRLVNERNRAQNVAAALEAEQAPVPVPHKRTGKRKRRPT